MKKIILIIMIITLAAGTLNTAWTNYITYWVYDEREEVWRNYHTLSNFAHTMKEINDKLMEGITVITNTTIQTVRSNVIIEVEKECPDPSWWDSSKFWIGTIMGIIAGILITNK